ncbi:MULTISPECIES: glycosyltransferase [unclassified Microbacterium]|uniref:glycosyltransferase n=1 Tax=unclassified Microbacterium TaxID=2609290 RepID=UPI003C304664
MSIVVPLFNDEDHVAAALDSCLRQSLRDIEIICVDDASTDETASIVSEYASRDARVRLIRQPLNMSAFQARRAGVDAATAPYVMFLDGDDELAEGAARTALGCAKRADADVVGFGVEIVTRDGDAHPRRFEAALQPQFDTLLGPQIIPGLFPVGQVANGHLWRYLFSTHLLRRAYSRMPADATFYRANDLPITFLALSYAKKYVSTAERLYRYFFRRGTSGHAIDALEHFHFLMSGIDPISHIRDIVFHETSSGATPQPTLNSYESARLHIIASVLRSCLNETSGELQRECIDLLADKVGDFDLIKAAATFVPESLSAVSARFPRPSQPESAIRNVLLTTAHLDRGGLQSVLLRQAADLTRAGYGVTVAVFRESDHAVVLPDGVALVVIGEGMADRLAQWVDVCRTHEIDLIIDHHILYNNRWPWFAIAAQIAGIPTIGWVHNFALRPIFDHRRHLTFMAANMRNLLRVVTLSPTDVAFWKLQGVPNVVYLPNPPSPLTVYALEREGSHREITAPLKLAWWGRLDRPTKQVDHLIAVAAELTRRQVDYELTIIGPDSPELTGADVRDMAADRGVGRTVKVVGDLTPEELLTTLEEAHLLVSTSAIEGYQLTIVEAQAMGMPVAMYELPWLETIRGNDGVLTTTSEPASLADAIVALASDPTRYRQMSEASAAFARASTSLDVGELTDRLISGTLPEKFSPDPTLHDAEILIDWLVRYAERGIRVINRGSKNGGDARALRRKVRRAEAEVHHITSGPSYRIGRLVTYIPRKLRGMLRRRDPR